MGATRPRLRRCSPGKRTRGAFVRSSMPTNSIDGLARVQFLRTQAPGLEIPPFDEALLRSVLDEAALHARSFQDLRHAGLMEFVRGRLTVAQARQLEEWCPDRVTLPGGRRVRVGSIQPMHLRLDRVAAPGLLRDAESDRRSRAAECHWFCICSHPTSATCRSPRIWRAFGPGTIRRSRRSCAADTRDTRGRIIR